jgi:import inner membrane translocase subunit TIM44
MIPTKMSATRVASLRSQAPTLRASSRLSARVGSYSTVSAQTPLLSAKSHRAILHSPSHSVPQLLSPFAALPLTRSFHVATSLWQQQQQQKQQEGKQGEDAESESKHEDSKEEGTEKQEEKAPPPPHGDKSPWQVFRETLQTEFKASKEWEESTKALASSAHQFTENENVRRARAAYEAASSATTSKTSTAFKTTGQVIGKGAAWTWNTSVVKGVRKGVNATGEGLEKATRPVRQTEAYKSVKEAIDDGSSSRYGGWVEKEERRRQRQLREEQELKAGKFHRVEQRVEDPK